MPERDLQRHLGEREVSRSAFHKKTTHGVVFLRLHHTRRQITGEKKKPPRRVAFSGTSEGLRSPCGARLPDQWNCSSSVEPVRAFTLDEPPWITVVTSSK